MAATARLIGAGGSPGLALADRPRSRRSVAPRLDSGSCTRDSPCTLQATPTAPIPVSNKR